jgi:hypothetical protein
VNDFDQCSGWQFAEGGEFREGHSQLKNNGTPRAQKKGHCVSSGPQNGKYP